MAYYAQEPSDHGCPRLWEIDDRVATRVGIGPSPGADRFEANEGETPFDVMRRTTSWFGTAGHCPFHRIPIAPGQYYPRMARPTEGPSAVTPGFWSGGIFPPSSPGERNDAHVTAKSLGRMKALIHRLARICQTVHPADDRIGSTYGNDIADLLISACMEFETQCRGVLAANAYAFPANGGKTPDYVRLLTPLKLAEYAIGFTSFPWLDPEWPFGAWDPNAPTRTLTWYQAYHAVKHDRDANFSEATLAHALRAVSACAVMMLAQYGERRVDSELESFFWREKVPRWSAAEWYFQPLATQFPDGSNRRGDWTPVSYPFQRAICTNGQP